MNNIGCKLFVCLVLVGSYFLLPKYGFTAFSFSLQPPYFNLQPSTLNLLYPFSHANIWHLLANILCLFMLRCPLHIFATYTIAVIASFIPSFSLYGFLCSDAVAAQEVTYGFSGVLFAIVGISWGKVHRFRDMLTKNIWFLIIPAFIPHINFLIHLYCLLLGYLYGRLCCDAVAAIKKKLSSQIKHYALRIKH